MKLINDFCFLAFFILASTTFNVAYAENQPQKNQIELAGQMVRSDRIIVRHNTQRQTISTFEQQDTLFSDLGLKEIETIQFNSTVPTARAANQDLSFTILALDGSNDLKTVLKQLNDHPSVMYAEPDYIYYPKLLPNDEQFSQLWGLDNQGQEGGTLDADIDAPEAWDISTDSSNIVVGIIDTGVDYTHEDLAANMWVNPGEIPEDGIDNDGNGYIDDIHGIDCGNDDSDPMDEFGHGSHVAGTIGAKGNNGIGIVGVNWNAKIMALKVEGGAGGQEEFTSNIVECLAYAVNMKQNYGVDIRLTNNSYGGSAFSQSVKDAIQASSDMLFIASAGNNSTNTDSNPHYPSSFNLDNIISVAATTRTDNLAYFSNFGSTTVDLGAPGLDILSTIPGNQYAVFGGTSMAAPHVSGAAALLWSNNPSMTALEIKNKLMDLGDPIPALEHSTASGNRLNINNALNCIPGSPVLRILTPGNQFNLLTGDVVVKARVTDCGEAVTGVDVLALPENGDATFNLFDDGQGEDTTANDGIYTGIWQLQNPGNSVTLNVIADSLGLSAFVNGVVGKNYSVDATHPFQWIDATSGTRLNISDSDDSTETVTIGFDFEFYGVPYSEVRVDSNGMLTFGFNNTSYFSNRPIPENTQPNGFISPYWDDLFPGRSDAANIYTLLEGTAPNRRLTIAWVETPLFDRNASDGVVTAEVTLYEGSNDIVLQYKDAYLADSATIGLEHISGNDGLQYLHNGENNGEPVQIHEEQAIRFFFDDITTPGTTSFTPSDDANNRANLDGVLAVSKWEHAFFRFDVSAVEDEVSKATLRVYYEAHRAPLTLFVGAVDDDNWSEENGTPAVTFIHDKPELQLDSVAATAPGYVEFDVTSFVADQVSSDGIVTLEVSSSHDNWDNLSSKEGEHPPELLLETDNQPPVALFNATPDSGDAPLTVILDASEATDPDGEILVYRWDFGDGTTASGVNVTHVYNNIGDYTVNLTVVDNNGNTDVVSEIIQVFCPPNSAVLEILTPPNQFTLPTGDVNVQAQVSECGQPITGLVVDALPDNGDPSFVLFDDGQEEDVLAGDGIYTGIWQLPNAGEMATLTVSEDSLGLSASVSGDVVSNYKMDPDYPFEWIDATSATRLSISDVLDGTETLEIGFDFEFYGVPYSEVIIDSNGMLKFGDDNTSFYINSPIPNNSFPNGFIAPYWDDLFPGSSEAGNIYALLQGTAPNRSLTITWIKTPLYFSYSNDSPITMQVTLYEGSNDIVFQYDGSYQADSATIGIEHQSGDYGLQFLFDGQNNGEPVQIHSEQAIRFYFEDDSINPGAMLLIPTDDANNRADLDGVLAVSKWEHAFFRFDASAVQQEVNKATLRVYYEAHRAPLTLFVGAVEDDNWTEEGDTPVLTYIHNRPDLQLDSVEGTAPGYVEFDVTGFVADQVNGDGIVTLEVSSSHDNWDNLSSKEGAFPPELIIESGTQPNQQPNVVFDVIPESGEAPLTILLDASASNDPDGEIVSYEWDLGDGTTASGVSVNHTYSNSGEYTISLTLTDNNGATNVATKIVNVDDSTQPTGPELNAGYPFEEGTGGAILDSSGNGNDGTLEGNATRNTNGYFGEAIEFNGSDSYIDLGTMDITSPNMTIALWFKADDFGIHDARFISKSTGTAESDHYWMVSTIRNGGQQKLRFRLKTENGGTSTLIGNAALTADEWTHVTATYDGAEMKLFQDGVEVGSLTKTGAIATSASVETWIGANPGNTRYFDGLIDDVRIYGEAIGSATIEDIMQGNLPLNP